MRDADIAMHYAKEKNDGPAVFTKELRSRFLERIRYEMDLRHAIDRGELAMNYQPIISLSDGRLVGFEALLRWHHPEFGMIPPNRFISIAEDSGLIQPITVWILHQTCAQLGEWQQISPEYKNLIVSVNISGKHLAKDDLIEDVLSSLRESRISAHTLKLEITESTAMENAEHTIDVLNRLKQIGVQLSIDDFGTGYSSLSHLHRLPFDTEDRSLVRSVSGNAAKTPRCSKPLSPSRKTQDGSLPKASKRPRSWLSCRISAAITARATCSPSLSRAKKLKAFSINGRTGCRLETGTNSRPSRPKLHFKAPFLLN